MTIIIKIEYPNHECDADHLILEASPHEDADQIYRFLKTELSRKLTPAEEGMDFLDVVDTRIEKLREVFRGIEYHFLSSDYTISTVV